MDVVQQLVGESKKVTGSVKFFNSSKGFGFLVPDGKQPGEADVFVHQSAIHAQGFRSLAEGENVEFEVVLNDDGREKAINVTGPNGAHVQGAAKPSYDDNRYSGSRGGRGGRGGFNNRYQGNNQNQSFGNRGGFNSQRNYSQNNAYSNQQQNAYGGPAQFSNQGEQQQERGYSTQYNNPYANQNQQQQSYQRQGQTGGYQQQY